MDPIRLIPWNEFQQCGSFPRYPQQAHICVDLTFVDIANLLIVFISHCWLRGWSGAEGYDPDVGKHPDNANHDKYQLCLKGIELLRKSQAPDIPNCYIWLDFGCINQDGNPAGELKQLDKIMQCCDMLFTPVAGDDKWNFDKEGSSTLFDVNGYVNRGWCRLEMFYAANISLHEHASAKLSKFKSGLYAHASAGRRPQFIYGRHEVDRYPPVCLPPLQNSYFEQYHPEKGFLTVEEDRAKIAMLVAELKPYMNQVEVGYEGDYKDGKKHGHGIFRYANGNIYEGEFKDGKKHGHGIYRYANGGVYDGDWKDGKMIGHGIFRYANGNVYDGEFKNDKRHGHGIFRYADGNVYDGEFKDGNMHGHGIYRSADGSINDGEYKDNEI
jgi:hypothetical protein